jgi:hypothetical protein
LIFTAVLSLIALIAIQWRGRGRAIASGPADPGDESALAEFSLGRVLQPVRQMPTIEEGERANCLCRRHDERSAELFEKIWDIGAQAISSPSGSETFRVAPSAIPGAHLHNTLSAFPPAYPAPYILDR